MWFNVLSFFQRQAKYCEDDVIYLFFYGFVVAYNLSVKKICKLSLVFGDIWNTYWFNSLDTYKQVTSSSLGRVF